MEQGGVVSTTNQTHNGTGDNVQQKFLVQIQALAPANIAKAIALVLGSIRKKDIPAAKLQLEMLRATEHGNQEVASLLDVIALYGELVEPDRTNDAFNAVSRIAATAQDLIVTDLCIAALLKFSKKTDYQEAALTHYQSSPSPGPYSREAYYRDFAPQDALLAANKQLIVSEGELTGIVEGAIRLMAIDIATTAAKRLHELYPSYNARVLLTITKAHELNPVVSKTQYWLTDPKLRKSIDQLMEDVSALIELSEGNDVRLYSMAGPMLNYFQVAWPTRLLSVCAKYVDQMALSCPEVAARVRSTQGDHSALSEQARSFALTEGDSDARTIWCKAQLESDSVDLPDAVNFVRVATSAEIQRWLELDKPINGAGDLDSALIKLLAHLQLLGISSNYIERYKLGLQVDEFLARYSTQCNELSVSAVVELGQAMLIAVLPEKALALTTLLLPSGEVWPSPFILLHMRCLLEAEQSQSFDDLLKRIPEADNSLALMKYRSMKEEALGDSDLALALSDQMVSKAPDHLYSWLRGCELRDRFRDMDELRRFLDTIPEHLLDAYSLDAVLVMRFLIMAGNFKQAEPRLVKWFMDDPSGRARMLVNVHFECAQRRQAEFDVSGFLPGYLAGVEFEQDGRPQIRLIVEEGQATGQHVLPKDSQLAKLLVSLELGDSAPLGMINYKLLSRLPPYVACIRLASQIRHLQNDGSDVFAMFELPDDPTQLVPYLEQKLGTELARPEAPRLEVPLYIHAHSLQSDDPIKSAYNAWSDSTVHKEPFLDSGVAEPTRVVLDAFSITYLAMTNLVDRMIDMGITFILPIETKGILQRWVAEVTHKDFLMMGIDAAGRLIRTTASDVQAREGHTLRGMQRILDESVAMHSVIHDTPLELVSIKDGIDLTVYLAMQLSLANQLPWFCMDATFAGLHQSTGYPIVNVNRALIQALDTPKFDFEAKRHGLFLYALGAVPRPLMRNEIKGLAGNPNAFSSFILYKILQKHGEHIFVDNGQQELLLDALLTHLICTFYKPPRSSALEPDYTPWCRYDQHVFNHALRLFITRRGENSAEFWLALALKVCMQIIDVDARLARYTLNTFSEFARGHFLDFDAIAGHFKLINVPHPSDVTGID
ncbi:hypothetical protein D3C77_241440 [compost metagenome]